MIWLADIIVRKASGAIQKLGIGRKRAKKYYRVGDVAPDDLLARDADAPPIGAWITVDPETRRITRIWAP